MSLSSFLDTVHPDAAPPGLTDWLDICDIDVPSGSLSVMDPMLFPGVVVAVPPGAYRVSVQLMNCDGSYFVARIRVLAPGATGRLGGCLGEVAIDFAQLTVGDRCAIETAGKELNSPECAQALLKALETSNLFGFVPWNTAGTFCTPFVQSAQGDGVFPVYELVDEHERTGVQVDFLEEG